MATIVSVEPMIATSRVKVLKSRVVVSMVLGASVPLWMLEASRDRG